VRLATIGNFPQVQLDYHRMGCERYREALSARLDGEDLPLDAAELDTHLAGCAACRQWAGEAAAVTRVARIQLMTARPRIDPAALAASALVASGSGGPGSAGPGLGAARRHRPRLSRALRAVLGAFGAAQFGLGILQSAGSAAQHDHGSDSPLGVNPGHLWHESAAWNVAIGAGFAWIALRRGRPNGALPMLTAFVALLGLLSVNDISAGRVDGLRLLSHGFVVAGYVIVVALCRPSLDPGQPPAGRQGPPWRWRAKLDLHDEPAPAGPPSLRLIQGQASAARLDQAA
jgi:predicted anti-sigma-YlaC factor YlaD